MTQTTEKNIPIGKYLVSLKSTSPNPAKVDKADVEIVANAAKRAERVPCSSQGGRLLTRELRTSRLARCGGDAISLSAGGPTRRTGAAAGA